jgi:hypothetical protein
VTLSEGGFSSLRQKCLDRCKSPTQPPIHWIRVDVPPDKTAGAWCRPLVLSWRAEGQLIFTNHFASVACNKFRIALTWIGGCIRPVWTKAKLARQPLVYTTLQILHFNRNSFSSFVHTNAPTLYAIRAEITDLMKGVYCQYDRHRRFSLSCSLEVYIACYRVKLRGTSASFSMALCQFRKWI